MKKILKQQISPTRADWLSKLWSNASVVFLPTVLNLNLIMRKYQTRELGNVLQKNQTIFFKTVKVKEDKERLRTVSDSRGIKSPDN